MLNFQLATADQYDEFLQLMWEHMADYVQSLMAQMQMSWEEFVEIYRSLGEVNCIYWQDQSAGYYWIELREHELHLHGLILKDGFRGQGIGTAVLGSLAAKYSGQVDLIELGVHQSNVRAIAWYERLGFETVRVLDDLGFLLMQKQLGEKE